MAHKRTNHQVYNFVTSSNIDIVYSMAEVLQAALNTDGPVMLQSRWNDPGSPPPTPGREASRMPRGFMLRMNFFLVLLMVSKYL